MKRVRICYPTIFRPEEDGSAYTVIVPDMEQIPCGCTTCGDTFEEACRMAEEAIGFAIEDAVDGKYPIPSRPETFTLEPGDFIVPIWYDSIKYAQAVGTKSISRTISLPEWLDDLAREENLKYSKILQEALKKKLDLE